MSSISLKPNSVPMPLDPADNKSEGGMHSLKQKPMNLRRQTGVDQNRAHEVSKMYEEQFLRSMVSAMRSTVSESDILPGSMAEKHYKQELDDKYVNMWTEQGGVGIADVIYQQIMDRYGDKGHIVKPKGPVTLKSTDQARVSQFRTSDKEGLTYQVERLKNQAHQQALEILSPWDATVVGQSTLPDGKRSLLLDHDNGVRTRYLFDGTTSALVGSKVSAGEKVGLLGPESSSFIYNVQEPRHLK